MKAWFGEHKDGRWVIAGTTPNSYPLSLRSRTALIQIKTSILPGLPSKQASVNRPPVTGSDAPDGHRTGPEPYYRHIVDRGCRHRAVDQGHTVIDAYNEMSERLVEWYGIHHPEKIRPQEIIDRLATLQPEDLDSLRSYASSAKALAEERKRLEKYVACCMADVAPNLSDVLGPMLGARLIARAGGLDRLAKLPASALQVMGAREALFRHIREGTPPPKHGFIYPQLLVSDLPKRLRGKISRCYCRKSSHRSTGGLLFRRAAVPRRRCPEAYHGH